MLTAVIVTRHGCGGGEGNTGLIRREKVEVASNVDGVKRGIGGGKGEITGDESGDGAGLVGREELVVQIPNDGGVTRRRPKKDPKNTARDGFGRGEEVGRSKRTKDQGDNPTGVRLVGERRENVETGGDTGKGSKETLGRAVNFLEEGNGDGTSKKVEEVRTEGELVRVGSEKGSGIPGTN